MKDDIREKTTLAEFDPNFMVDGTGEYEVEINTVNFKGEEKLDFKKSISILPYEDQIIIESKINLERLGYVVPKNENGYYDSSCPIEYEEAIIQFLIDHKLKADYDKITDAAKKRNTVLLWIQRALNEAEDIIEAKLYLETLVFEQLKNKLNKFDDIWTDEFSHAILQFLYVYELHDQYVQMEENNEENIREKLFNWIKQAAHHEITPNPAVIAKINLKMLDLIAPKNSDNCFDDSWSAEFDSILCEFRVQYDKEDKYKEIEDEGQRVKEEFDWIKQQAGEKRGIIKSKEQLDILGFYGLRNKDEKFDGSWTVEYNWTVVQFMYTYGVFQKYNNDRTQLYNWINQAVVGEIKPIPSIMAKFNLKLLGFSPPKNSEGYFDDSWTGEFDSVLCEFRDKYGRSAEYDKITSDGEKVEKEFGWISAAAKEAPEIITAKANLEKLGYDIPKDSSFDGSWSDKFNDVLDEFIEEYEKSSEYTNISDSLKRKNLFNWIQQAASGAVQAPKVVIIKLKLNKLRYNYPKVDGKYFSNEWDQQLDTYLGKFYDDYGIRTECTQKINEIENKYSNQSGDEAKIEASNEERDLLINYLDRAISGELKKVRQSGGETIDIAKDIAKKTTVKFEGGQVSGNFDGAGISIGYLQFNLKSGDLQPIMRDMMNGTITAESSNELNEIFNFETGSFNENGSEKKGYEIIREIMQPISTNEQIAWGNSISNQNNKTYLIEPWNTAFNKLVNNINFINAEDKEAQKYFNQANNIMNKIGIKTIRCYVLSFDIAVQVWDVNLSLVNDAMNGEENILTDINLTGDGTQARAVISDLHECIRTLADDNLKKLYYVAATVAISADKEYNMDVWSRKSTIVRGTGIVHGSNYNLTDIGVNDNIIGETTGGETISGTAEEKRQKVVQLEQKWVGSHVKYLEDENNSIIVNLNSMDPNSLPQGFTFDCSSFAASIYYTLFGKMFPRCTHKYGNVLGQQDVGVNIEILRDSNMHIDVSNLKLGDLVFLDYDKNGETDHVMTYIGDGKLIHMGGSGINYSRFDEYWGSYGYVENNVTVIRRMIDDNGELTY